MSTTTVRPVYWKGDRAEYTGKSDVYYGVVFYDLLLLEGHRKGETVSTPRPPVGATEIKEYKPMNERTITMRQQEFLNALERNWHGMEHVSTGACPGCSDCLECETPEDPSVEWHDLANEPHFSCSSCDSCGSSLGGDRHPVHAFAVGDESRTIYHYDVCTDCLFYLANGELPEVGKDESNEQ